MKKFFVFILVFFAFPVMAGSHARNFLQIVLNNMQENYQHSIGVPFGSYAMYVDKDGKKEAVYDKKNGNRVDDPINQGDYNFFPYEMGIKHFLFDRFRWLNLGHSEEDVSSYNDRLMAWIDDFAVSFEKTCQVQPDLLTNELPSFDEDSVWADAMEKVFQPLLSDIRLEEMLSSNPCKLIDSFNNGNQEELLYLRKVLIENFKNGPLTGEEVDKLYFLKLPVPDEIKDYLETIQ